MLVVMTMSLMGLNFGLEKDKDSLVSQLSTAVENQNKAIMSISLLEKQVKDLTKLSTVTNLGEFRITYYCNNCDKCGTHNITSDGTKLNAEIQSVAVDPEYIPIGTILAINGKLYIANDKGDAVKGRVIDIMIYDTPHDVVYAMGVDHYKVWGIN